MNKSAFKLEQWLKSRRMTKKDFARDMGVSYYLMSRFANDRKLPSLSLALRVEEATEGYVKAAEWVVKTADLIEAAE